MQYLGEGRNRLVFRAKNGKYVRKFPLNDEGFSDNYREAYLFSRGEGYIKLAKCRLSKSGVLIMEYVEPQDYSRKLPEWVDFVDCQQVGYNRHGKLVAYDYA